MHGSHLALDTRSQLIAVMLLYKGGTSVTAVSIIWVPFLRSMVHDG